MEAKFPTKLKPLWLPKRYKILYGGRGGAKSWGIARALLLQGAQKPLRILCAREIQKSIGDSVHQLLRDQIGMLGLDGFYEVQKTTIIGSNGTTFGFEGLKHNVTSLKSYEGADKCWVEEAHAVSKTSWDTLIPTIRKGGSEIWISFNAELEEDETYQRFVVSPPKESVVIKIGWRDNPWFPDVLMMEKDELKGRDPAAYDNVWEGNCREAVEGAIYSDEMRLAAEEGRIINVKYDSSKPVNTYWDLGHSDQTAIWFVQQVGLQYRVLRYYSNSHKKMNHYLKYLQEQEYVYGHHYFPHDASAETLGAEKTIEQQALDALKDITVLEKLGLADGIEITRNVFPHCYFDKELTADGLSALRRYAYKKDMETGRVSKNPEHSVWSHGADAFRYFGVAESQGQYEGDEPPQQDWSLDG